MVEPPPDGLLAATDPKREVRMVHPVLGARAFQHGTDLDGAVRDGWTPDYTDTTNFLESVHIQAYYFGISYDYSKFLAFSVDYTVMQETVLGSNLTVGGQSIATITGGACAACGQFVNYNNQILGLRALITF